MDIPESCRHLIDHSVWIYAKTMPGTPHAYIVRSAENEAEFVEFVQYIRDHGFKALYGSAKTMYTYWEYQGYRYWTMGNPISETTIINRCSTDLYGVVDTPEGKRIMCKIVRKPRTRKNQEKGGM